MRLPCLNWQLLRYGDDNEADERQRYQVGGHRLVSGKNRMCGMIAVQAQIIWGANLIPLGAACGADDPRRKPARSRVPANDMCD